MLSFSDHALILALHKHGESSALATVLTAQHGLYKAMARGAYSQKQRGVYQPANEVMLRWQARIPEHMGHMTAELLTPYAARCMPFPNVLAMLAAASALLTRALPERHPYPRLYQGLEHWLITATETPEHAPEVYLRFELLLLCETGFGLDLSRCAATGRREALTHVSPKSGRAVSAEAAEPYLNKLLPLPAFLQSDTYTTSPTRKELLEGLRLTGYFLEHWLFSSLQRKYPTARLRLGDHW